MGNVGKLNRRGLKVILIVSVVIATVLFVGLKLIDILEQRSAPKIITVDAVTWSITKPQETVSLTGRVESLYEYDNDVVSVRFFIYPSTYHVRYSDYQEFRISCTATTSLGFIQSVNINFSRTDAYSVLRIFRDEGFIENRNLNIWRFDEQATSTLKGM